MFIGNDYKVESDELNVILCKKRISQKGKNKGQEYWKVIGFYGTPQSALKALVDLKVRETGLKDLKTVIAKQEELYRLIEQISTQK